MAGINTTKRNPWTLIRTFIAIEAVVVFLYFVGTFLDARLKYELFTYLPYSESFTYQTLKLIALSVGQLLITSYAFLRWYRAEKTFEHVPVKNLLAKDEGETLEFKSSLRYDHKLEGPNKDLEKAAMKTIAAFLNSKGGRLIVGVDNAKNIVGLAHDYPLLQRPGVDGFENHFTQVFNSMIGPEFRHLVHISFHTVNSADVCVVETLPGTRPAYLKANGSEHFYIRTGNTTTLLKLSEIEVYRSARFPQAA